MLGSDIVKYFLRRVADGDVNIVSGRFCSVEKRITRLEPREGGGLLGCRGATFEQTTVTWP